MPMIARWPSKVQPGTESDLPSAFWDFLPTACEAAGIETPGGIDGISYLPTLLGQSDIQSRHEYLYWASQEGDTSIGVRRGPWKLVRYRKNQKGRPDWRLYDLRQDIGELNDVSEKNSEIVREIQGLLKRDQLPLETAPKK